MIACAPLAARPLYKNPRHSSVPSPNFQHELPRTLFRSLQIPRKTVQLAAFYQRLPVFSFLKGEFL